MIRSNLRYHSNICLEGLRKTTKNDKGDNQNFSRDSKHIPSEHKLEAWQLVPPCSIFQQINFCFTEKLNYIFRYQPHSADTSMTFGSSRTWFTSWNRETINQKRSDITNSQEWKTYKYGIVLKMFRTLVTQVANDFGEEKKWGENTVLCYFLSNILHGEKQNLHFKIV